MGVVVRIVEVAEAHTAVAAGVARMVVVDRTIADRFSDHRMIFDFPQPLWPWQRRARAAFFNVFVLMPSSKCDTLRLK